MQFSGAEEYESLELCRSLWPAVPDDILQQFISDDKRVTQEDALRVFHDSRKRSPFDKDESKINDDDVHGLHFSDTLTSLLWGHQNNNRMDASAWCLDSFNQIAGKLKLSDISQPRVVRVRQCIASALLRNGLQKERLQRAFVVFALRQPDLCFAILTLHQNHPMMFEVPLDVNLPFRERTALHVCAFTARSPLLLQELIRCGNMQASKPKCGEEAKQWYSALTRRSKHCPHYSVCRLCYDWVDQATISLQSPSGYRFKEDMVLDRPIDAIVQWWTGKQQRRNTRCSNDVAQPSYTIAHERALECLLILIRHCSDNATVLLEPQFTPDDEVSLDSPSLVWSCTTPGSDLILRTPRQRLLDLCTEIETKLTDGSEYADRMSFVRRKIRQELKDVRDRAIYKREALCRFLVHDTGTVHGVPSIALLVLEFVFPVFV